MAKTSAANPMYVYVGQGFIAGLPKTVTMQDAEQLGLLEELKAAIANGAYVETIADQQGTNADGVVVEWTPLSAKPTSPQIGEHDLGGKRARSRKESN